MAVRDKRDSSISPVLIKFGVALAFSIGGIVYTFFRSKRILPPKPKPPPKPPGKGNQDEESGDLGDEDRARKDLSLPRVSCPNSISDLSSSHRCIRDNDSVFFTELDHLINECDKALLADDKNRQSLFPKVEYKCAEDEEHEKEIRSLRSKVKILEERERILENQLLEYYGLKEQETAVMELQNRLRVHNMEAKLYNLKIESLQSDNRKLQAQVADYSKVVTELESAQAKIKMLRRKLRFEAEQNREQILKLQERVMKLQDHETRAGEIDQDSEVELRKKLDEMKKENDSLKLENSELAEKLENLQILAASALDSESSQALKEESQLLRQQNEDLRKEIEQLQADRCMDVEELVYLRWINACLRYEMRNYQPSPGETIARDLSKTLSPESEKKAKRLILEYANKEGIGDFDCDEWSASHASYLSESGEPGELPVDNLPDNKTSHPRKKKLFAKLMKLLQGKDIHHHDQTPSSPTERAISVDEIASHGLMKTARTKSSHSFDLQRSYSRGQKSSTGESSSCSRRTSDDGSLSIFRRIDSITGYDDNLCLGTQPHHDAQNAAKMELAKYAEALKNSSAKKPLFRRRSASFSSV